MELETRPHAVPAAAETWHARSSAGLLKTLLLDGEPFWSRAHSGAAEDGIVKQKEIERASEEEK